MSFGVLQNKLKKKFDNVMNGWNIKKQYACANTIMLLRDWCLEQLVETEKSCVVISKEELHKLLKKHYFSRAFEDTLKQIELELLELGDEK